jgi:hypothetical protein
MHETDANKQVFRLDTLTELHAAVGTISTHGPDGQSLVELVHKSAIRKSDLNCDWMGDLTCHDFSM